MKNNNDAYMKQIHLVGRIGSLIVMVAFMIAGVLVCAHFDWFPTGGQFAAAVLPLLIMGLGQSFGEFMGYYPKIGPGGSYIGFITGNIMTMKVPSVVGTLEALEVEDGSEKFHVVTVLASVTGSIFVMLLLGIVVLFADQLTPFLNWSVIQPAINNVMPALTPIVLMRPLRQQPGVCILTALILVPIIYFLNPLTNTMAGMFGGMIICAILSAIAVKRAEKKKAAANTVE